MLVLMQIAIDAIMDGLIGLFPVTTSTPPEKVMLFTNNAVLSKTTALADLTPATFNGSAPKTLATGGTGTRYADPLTGEIVTETPQALGGLTFVCAVDPAAPETIYGFAITTNDGTILLAAEKLTVPIVINKAGQGLDVAAIYTRFTPEIAIVG